MGRFTEGECAVIIEALHNVVEDNTLSRHSLLMNTVINNANIDALRATWDCSEVSLVRKLGGLSEKNMGDLLARVAQFWRIASHVSIADGLREVGLLPRQTA